jgi:hypothetical protein
MLIEIRMWRDAREVAKFTAVLAEGGDLNTHV